MPLKCHLPGNRSTWNVIVSHRRSPDFSTQPNCCNRPSVIWSPRKFLASQFCTRASNVNEGPVRIVLPFKDQRSANSARRQLEELNRKIEICRFYRWTFSRLNLYLYMYISFRLVFSNLKMISERSKRRFLSLVFILKCVSKKLLKRKVCKGKKER